MDNDVYFHLASSTFVRDSWLGEGLIEDITWAKQKPTRWGKISRESLCQLTLDSWRVFFWRWWRPTQRQIIRCFSCSWFPTKLSVSFLLFMVRTCSSSESEGFVQLSMVSLVKKEWMIFYGNTITSTQVHSGPFLRQWSFCSIWSVQIDDVHLHKKWKFAC